MAIVTEHGRQLETYEVEEVQDEQNEIRDTEAVALVEQLNLAGQARLFAKSKRTDGQSITERVPYRQMRKMEEAVFKVLCPANTDVANFDAEPIPLRVMQVLAHAMSLNFFRGFEVWSAEGQIKDPVLIGIRVDDEARSWDTKKFLLARWGAELDEWGILVEKAIRVWSQRVLDSLKNIVVATELDRKIVENGVSIETVAKNLDAMARYMGHINV